jgi:two-component system CheB/CheR fusion protein
MTMMSWWRAIGAAPAARLPRGLAYALVIGWTSRGTMSTENGPIDATAEGMQEEAFERLVEYLGRTRGFDFAAYKRPSLTRRVQRRMEMLGLGDYERYIEYLDAHADEFSYLFNTILINVTAFFRDGAPWDFLRTDVIPRLVADGDPDGAIRIWSAGCASGEEPYTIAMLLAEALGREAFARRVKIYATDVDDDALQQARTAVYPASRVEGVPAELLEKYFERYDGARYAFDKELRRGVIFGRHDLLQDAPISRIGLLVCRNTLMYFNADRQLRILARLHFALADGGFLLFGKAEMLLTRSQLFVPVDPRLRVFRKVTRNGPPEGVDDARRADHLDETKTIMTKQTDISGVAFDAAPIAQIVVDAGGALSIYNDRARSLFGLVATDVGRAFHELELSYRPIELRSLIQDAQDQRRPIVVKGVRLEARDREARSLDVQVTPLFDPQGRVVGTSVTFIDASRVEELQQQLSRSKQDLETTYEELQSTNEELETTNEELQSTVEELETTNEELQSTNEELETMNEELQSTNEELQAINGELRDRSESLSGVNHFLESVMRGMRGSVIVVNQELHVIAWNQRSEELWGLRAAEVRNKNVFSLDIGLPIDRFRREILACLSGEQELTSLSVEAINRRGKTVPCKVTCTPLTGKDQIQGVILLVDEAVP